jgi:hypothetical protein
LLPPRLLRLLPAGATVAGRDSHPLKDRALARHTTKIYLSSAHLSSSGIGTWNQVQLESRRYSSAS